MGALPLQGSVGSHLDMYNAYAEAHAHAYAYAQVVWGGVVWCGVVWGGAVRLTRNGLPTGSAGGPGVVEVNPHPGSPGRPTVV